MGEFVGTVVVVEGGGWTHRVELPAAVADALPVADTTRVVGTIAGHRFRRQLHGRDRVPFVAFGRTWLRRRDLVPGEPVEVTIEADPDPDGVDVPDELAAALDADPLVEHLWESLTPGRRRSLAHHVDRAVRDDTRARRVERIVADLHAGTA